MVDINNSQAENLKYTNLLDYFNFYLCPLAISMGMSAKEFWEDDPDYFWNYCEAKKMTDKKFYEDMNYNSYLNGIYSMFATAQNLVTKKKNVYPDKPFNLNLKNKQETVKDVDDKWKAYLFSHLKFSNK